jgi:hypothetical protein
MAIAALLVATGLPAAEPSDEILKLKDKIVELQNKGSLGFRNFTLCKKIIGFGSYVPLTEPTVGKQSEILAYFEPINVTTVKKDGLYEIWYTGDMVLLKENGEVLQEWKDFLSFKYTSKSPVMDLFCKYSLDLEGALAPGKYQLKAVLKDKLGDKTAAIQAPFEVK